MSRERKISSNDTEDAQIDDDFFKSLDNFKVVDVWVEKSKDTEGVKVKEEPEDESEANSRKRSSGNSSRSDRTHGSDKRSKSRERSFERRPRDPRPAQNRSPPRRRSPNRSNKGKTAFLEELRKDLANQGKDTSFLDDFSNPSRGRGRNNRYNNNDRQRFAQQNIMMNNFGPPQLIPNMNMMQMNYQATCQQFNPQMQVQYDMYGNPIMSQIMVPMDVPQPIPHPIPQPVPPPAPGTVPMIPQQYDLSPTIIHAQPYQQMSPPLNNAVQPQVHGNNATNKRNNNAMKKALNKGDLNLIDILRQKSKQQLKEQTQSAMASSKLKVKENCKKASDMIVELEKMKTLMPFTCSLTEVQTPQVKQIPTNTNKSPMLLSDNNAHFQFQTPASRCRVAFERNPLKLFQEQSKTLLPLARNMKLDMLEVSLKVKNQIMLKPKVREVVVNVPEVIESPPPSPAIILQEVRTMPTSKSIHKSIQATLNCDKCSKLNELKKDTMSEGTQTTEKVTKDVATQINDDDGSLTLTIDPHTLQNLSFDEQMLLKSLSERSAFNYNEPHNSQRLRNEDRHRMQEYQWDNERLNNFANPENPRNVGEGFVSFSPPHRSSIFNRIGDKVPTHSPSPQRHFEGPVYEYKVPSPPNLRRRAPPMDRNRSRSPSPFNRSPVGRNPSRSPSPQRLSPPRNRRPSPPKRARYDERTSFNNRRGRY